MAGRQYTDAQNVAFSRIAYYDLNDAFQAAQSEGRPLRLGDPGVLTDTQRRELEAAGISSTEYSQWTITAVHDTNAVNGFYGCVIETSPGQAAMAFRGSEGFEDSWDKGLVEWSKDGGMNTLNDWIRADLGLLHSTTTEQQAEVRRFMQENRELLSSYDSIGMTGHSLGGNLAEYGTIVSSEYGLDGIISQCVSLDGPGFSQEFIAAHWDQIQHMNDKMRHQRWSWVGNLLYDLPGVRYQDVQVENKDYLEKDYNSLTRHSLDYIKLDGSGRMVPGSKDPVAYIAGALSKAISFGTSVLLKPITTISVLREMGTKLDAWLHRLGDRIRGGTGRGSGGGGGSRGRADRIKVSTEDMEACVTRYRAERGRLEDALQICNSAAGLLARSWAGPSFVSLSAKLASAYGNLSQSLRKVDDAIDELNTTIRIMEQTEHAVQTAASSLDTGISPFV